MRLAIVHDVGFAFSPPARALIALVRLTPRTGPGQFVHDWRLDVSMDVAVSRSHDAFGNVVHAFTLDGPLEEASVTATGTVETEDTSGVAGPDRGRVPTEVFLRPTPATAVTARVRAFVEAIGAGTAAADPLDFAHRLNAAIARDHGAAAAGADAFATPDETLEGAGASSADLAHLFVAAARAAEVPARVAAGYRYDADRAAGEDGYRAWAEAFVGTLGWVGFDPATGLSVTDAYVRVAVAPDVHGAAPVRHAAGGTTTERVDMSVRVAPPRPGGGGGRLAPPPRRSPERAVDDEPDASGGEERPREDPQ